MSATLAREGAAERVFERLYRRHRRDVYRAVLRDVRNPADAEDVTQTAFLNAYRALRRGDEPERPRAWLLTIAQNVSRRRFRMQAVRPQEVELDPEIAAAPEVDGPTATEIREAIARLRPSHQEVLVLREIGGHSYAEIAEETGLSLAAVETLIFRARRALQDELEARPTARALALGWLPELVMRALGWLGRRGLAAKAAGAAGVAAVATGVSVQTGAVPLPDGWTGVPRADQPAGVSPALVRNVPVVRSQARKETGSATNPNGNGSASGDAAPVGGITLPGGAAPSLELPGVETPGLPLPEVPLPEAGVPVPEVPVPEVSVPDTPVPDVPLPEAQVPDVPIPDLPLPEVQVPEVQVPEVQVPDVQAPDVQVPEVQLPAVQLPAVQLPAVEPPALPEAPSLPELP
jgi:RNA polymerase sigma factor (sigma-70 family)